MKRIYDAKEMSQEEVEKLYFEVLKRRREQNGKK